MFRVGPRLALRPQTLQVLPRNSSASSRRFISTAPAAKRSRTWKSLLARIGIAGAIVYYYNTTDVFAEEPAFSAHEHAVTNAESEHYQTIDALFAERQKRKAIQAHLDAQKATEAGKAETRAQPQGASVGRAEGEDEGLDGLEEEADQQGAFNPETGEINWDCPCLGGMASGPCGEEFKIAFSCFVFSKEEPKGMDCIDKFKGMQTCFRQYPEVYGSELDSEADDDEEDDDLESTTSAPKAESTTHAPVSKSTSSDPAPKPQPQSQSQSQSQSTTTAASSTTAESAESGSEQPAQPAHVLTPPSYSKQPTASSSSNNAAKLAGDASAPRQPPQNRTSLVPGSYQPETKRTRRDS